MVGFALSCGNSLRRLISLLSQDNVSAIDVLSKGLKDLEEMTETILDRYEEAIAAGDYERVETPKTDLQSILARRAQQMNLD
jgi:hypothetical protein